MEITIFALFVVYTLACVADGEDVKPLWKKWLGGKLSDMAGSLYPYGYCSRRDQCCYYRSLKASCREIDDLKEQLRRHHPATPIPIPIQETTFDLKRIDCHIIISEGDLFMARRQELEVLEGRLPRFCIPDFLTVDGLVRSAKERLKEGLLHAAERYVSIEVDKECHYPGIMVSGYLFVGKRR